MIRLIGKAGRILSAPLVLLFLGAATDKPPVCLDVELRRQP